MALGENQTLITVPADNSLVEVVNEAAAADHIARALWIRRAVAEKLRRQGIRVPDEWVETAPRTGKGGRPKGKPAEAPSPAPAKKRARTVIYEALEDPPSAMAAEEEPGEDDERGARRA